MILVAGGSGRLGRVLLPMLMAGGHAVRVLTRQSDPAVPAGVEVVHGDVRDPDAIRAAVAGCATVISAVHGFAGGRGNGPSEIDREANIALMNAAEKAGASRFILVSVLDASGNHPLSLHRAKYAAEQHLAATKLAWTVVRPAAYLELWLDIVGEPVANGRPALVLGRGKNPINFVSVRDVASVIKRCLDEPTTAGRVVDIAGPENLTLLDLTKALNSQRVRHVPRLGMHIISRLARPFAPAFARQAAAGVVLDTADMTSPAKSLHEVRFHTLQDVLARRSERTTS